MGAINRQPECAKPDPGASIPFCLERATIPFSLPRLSLLLGVSEVLTM